MAQNFTTYSNHSRNTLHANADAIHINDPAVYKNIPKECSVSDKILSRATIASMLGNTLEWFEYCIYSQFAMIIAKQFFPSSNIADTMTWLVFTSGFLVRPIGGLITSVLGDKYGRKFVLSLTIMTMALPTVGIGLLPTYSYIGIAAPILLFMFRFIQGFSLGGEFSSCIIYTVESSEKQYRGLVGSLSFVSMCLGIGLGIISSILINSLLTQSQIDSWGWRIPFISGLFMGIVGIYMRANLKESDVYQRMKESRVVVSNPINHAWKTSRNTILLGSIMYMAVTSNFYMFAVYFQSLVQSKYIGYSAQQAIYISGSGLIAMIIFMPIAAYLSDQVGRKKLMLIGLACTTISTVALFGALASKTMGASSTQTWFLYLLTCACLSIYMGPIPAALVEMFRDRARFVGVSLSYNISAAIFGGTLPLVASSILSYTSSLAGIQWYLVALDCVAMLIVYVYYQTSKHSNL